MEVTEKIAVAFVNHIEGLNTPEQIRTVLGLFHLFEYSPHSDTILSALQERRRHIELLNQCRSEAMLQ